MGAELSKADQRIYDQKTQWWLNHPETAARKKQVAEILRHEMSLTEGLGEAHWQSRAFEINLALNKTQGRPVDMNDCPDDVLLR